MKAGKLEQHTARSLLLSVTFSLPAFIQLTWLQRTKHRNRKKKAQGSVEIVLCLNPRQAFEVSSPASQTQLAGVGSMLSEIRRTDDLNTKMSTETDMVIDTLLSPGSSLKSPSWVHGDMCACVTAAHVYHPPPRALSTERKMLARVQLCKSHLDVAFVINNLGAWLPPFLFSLPALLLEPFSTLLISSPNSL